MKIVKNSNRCINDEHTVTACEMYVYNGNIPTMDKTTKKKNITPELTIAFFCSR